MFRLASGSTARKNSFAQRRGTLRSVVFHLSLALALLRVGPAEHARPLAARTWLAGTHALPVSPWLDARPRQKPGAGSLKPFLVLRCRPSRRIEVREDGHDSAVSGRNRSNGVRR